jgi:5'(3')-deoxyribonucleotidase
VLGVDLDGVCGDHGAAFAAVVAEHRGIPVGELPRQRTWNFTEWGLTDEDFDRLHRVGVLEHRMFRSMPPVEGCADALWRLSDAGVWIRVVTHRLYANWGHAVVVSDTVAWLDDHGIPYRDLCFLGQKPQVDADVYVDDAPHNVEALRWGGATVIVFDQPYNRDLDGPRAHSWPDVEHLVLDLMAERGVPVQAQLPVGDGPDRLRHRLGHPVGDESGGEGPRHDDRPDPSEAPT